ncbi:Conserved_hypothetical protein [Hexamita inflata]|uniref:Uncharacterized protein n=1 Tax=Hexamita inflata TaxID=28002 RepID=A0AA86UI71_9EUKA|nr:Conserved hypothetical protein [Hexamita inflata]
MICNHRLQLSVSAGLFLVIKNRKVSIVSDDGEIVLQNATELPDSTEFGFFPHNNGLYLRISRKLFQITEKLQLITEVDEETQIYLNEQTTTNEKQNDSAPEFQALEENKCNSIIFALSRLGIETFTKYNQQQKNVVRINDKKILFPDQILKKHQLMNVIKLLPDYDLYLTVENNRIRIVNREFLIIGEIKVDFDFYTGYKNPNYCHGATSVFSPQLYTACICRGVIYIQYFDKIYKIRDAGLVFVVKIPDLRLQHYDSFFHRMFTLNDDLFVNSLFGYAYILRDDKLHMVQSIGECFYQFAKQIVVWTQKKETLQQLQQNLDIKYIGIFSNMRYFSFVGGGTLIFHSDECKNTLIFNMLDQSIVESTEQFYHVDKIKNKLELGSTGLQLPDKELVQLFGNDFPSRIQKEFENDLREQISKYPNYLVEIQKIIKQIMPQVPYQMETDLNKLLQTKVNLKKTEVKQAYPMQLMNVYKPFSDLYLFISIENNKIQILNEKCEILDYIDVDFDLYFGYKNPKYNSGKMVIFSAQMYTPVMCNGELYVQYFEKLVKIQNGQLEVVAEIPNINLSYFDSFFARMFCQNDQLYASNLYGSTYKLLNNNFERYNDTGERYYQFCNKTFMWSYARQCIYVIQNNMEEKQVCKIRENCTFYSFSQGGTLILHSSACQNVFIINLIDETYVELQNDKRFHVDNIKSHLALGVSGLQLKTAILTELFGANFVNLLEKSYNEYITAQSKFEQFVEIKKIFKMDILMNANQNAFQNRIQNQEQKFQQVQKQIKLQITKVDLNVTEYALKINSALLKCKEFISEEAQQ